MTRKLTELVRARCTIEEFNMIQNYANIFADGNVSLWLIYNALNGPFTILNENSLDDSARRMKGQRLKLPLTYQKSRSKKT